jgi:hypothetical protein
VVPGPLDIATPPSDSNVDDRTVLATQWVGWWHPTTPWTRSVSPVGKREASAAAAAAGPARIGQRSEHHADERGPVKRTVCDIWRAVLASKGESLCG